MSLYLLKVSNTILLKDNDSKFLSSTEYAYMLFKNALENNKSVEFIKKIQPNEILVAKFQFDYFSICSEFSKIAELDDWEFDSVLSSKKITEYLNKKYFHYYFPLD